MTTKVWIELEFEVEYSYMSAEPATDTNDCLELISISCDDPRVQGSLTIPIDRTPTMSQRVAAEHAKLIDDIEKDCRKDLEESYEDTDLWEWEQGRYDT